jgi:hypothetical protein
MPRDPDTAFVAGAEKLLAFQEAHPELEEPLAMWMADRSMCELMYSEAAEIFKREMPEFASDA